MNLIVGGTGFIGGHLAEYFFAQSEISRGIFRKGSYLRILDQCGVQCMEADLLDRSSLHEPLEGVDTVYNLASPTPKKDDSPQDYLRPNTEGVRNLLQEAKEHGTKTFVHLSTLDVYGLERRGMIDNQTSAAPSHPYQKAKLAADRLLMDFAKSNPGMKVRVVRAARAVGARDKSLVGPILRMASEGRIFVPAGGSKTSFSHPKDIAQALLKAASAPPDDQVILVKSFDSSSVELSQVIAKACDKSASVRPMGLFTGRTSLPAYSVSQLGASLHVGEQSSWKAIGYSPSYDLEKVGSEVAQWYKKEPWNIEVQA